MTLINLTNDELTDEIKRGSIVRCKTKLVVFGTEHDIEDCRVVASIPPYQEGAAHLFTIKTPDGNHQDLPRDKFTLTGIES